MKIVIMWPVLTSSEYGGAIYLSMVKSLLHAATAKGHYMCM